MIENAVRRAVAVQLGSSSMDSALLRHGAKDHFFRAAICRMCQDLQDGATAVGKYEEMCPAFTDSRECKLLKVGSFGLLICLLKVNVCVTVSVRPSLTDNSSVLRLC